MNIFAGQRKGLTLVESLVSIFIVGTLLVSVLGAFFISRLSTLHAQHRFVAVNFLRQYMEEELKQGYAGGEGGTQNDFYHTFDSAAARNETFGALALSITPDPYPAELLTINGTVEYKIVGFVATWNETLFGTGGTQTSTERVLTYVTNHQT